MSDIDPVHASAAELARSLQARTLSPVDAVEALLGRIERLEPRLQAFTEEIGRAHV